MRHGLLLTFVFHGLAASCASAPGWQLASRIASRAVREANAARMGEAVAALFARYNLPIRLPADLADIVARSRGRTAAALGSNARSGAVYVDALSLLVVAREAARAAANEHGTEPGALVTSARLAEEHAAACVRELARGDDALAKALDRAVAFAREARSGDHGLSASVRLMADAFASRAPPFLAQLAKVYPHTFDRSATRVVFAYPRARVCTLRTADAPEGATAAVSHDGRLFLGVAGAVREIPRSAPELRRRLTTPLGPGRLVHARGTGEARNNEFLFHIRASHADLVARRFALSETRATLDGSLVVRGGGFSSDVGTSAQESAAGTFTASRRHFAGSIEFSLSFVSRSAKRLGALAGAVGHRDGSLGRARFTMGANATSAAGTRVFYDPAARALRVLKAGAVGTIALSGRRDGVGEAAGVGRVTAVASVDDARYFVAERGRLHGGLRLFHLRALDLSGGPCQ